MPGVGVGDTFACGAREKNRLNCFLERASASSLLLPATCFSFTVKLFWAAVRKSKRMSDVSLGCLEDLPSQACTIA